MKFVKKHINENYFNNKEQLRAKAEKEKSQTAAERISSISNNAVKQNISITLKELIQKYDIDPLNIFFSNKYNNCITFYHDTYGDVQWNIGQTEIKIINNVSGTDSTFTLVGNSSGNGEYNGEIILNFHYDTISKSSAGLGSYIWMLYNDLHNTFSKNYNDDAGKGTWKLPSFSLRYIFVDELFKAANAELKRTSEKSIKTQALEFILHSKITLDKIGLCQSFDDLTINVYKEWPFDDISYKRKGKVKQLQKFLQSLSDLFVFENSGDVYFSLANTAVKDEIPIAGLDKSEESLNEYGYPNNTDILKYTAEFLKMAFQNFIDKDYFENRNMIKLATTPENDFLKTQIMPKLRKIYHNKISDASPSKIFDIFDIKYISLSYTEKLKFKLDRKTEEWNLTKLNNPTIQINFLRNTYIDPPYPFSIVYHDSMETYEDNYNEKLKECNGLEVYMSVPKVYKLLMKRNINNISPSYHFPIYNTLRLIDTKGVKNYNYSDYIPIVTKTIFDLLYNTEEDGSLSIK